MTESHPMLQTAPKLIFWDWNGTLLDDVHYAIGVRNRVFPRFGLPTVDSLVHYHEQFTFPVKLYYTRAGVTEDNFVEVAHAWMEEYERECDAIPLFADATLTLAKFADAGCAQVVLSASQVDILRRQLMQAGILEQFAQVLGLSHIYATSKEMIGRDYLAQTSLAPSECVMLGDTLHDAEVARAMGCRCVLIARGHQSRNVLQTAGLPVCDTLMQAAELTLAGKAGMFAEINT